MFQVVSTNLYRDKEQKRPQKQRFLNFYQCVLPLVEIMRQIPLEIPEVQQVL